MEDQNRSDAIESGYIVWKSLSWVSLVWLWWPDVPFKHKFEKREESWWALLKTLWEYLLKEKSLQDAFKIDTNPANQMHTKCKFIKCKFHQVVQAMFCM